MIGFIQHTTIDVIERRSSKDTSEWIMLEWMPELKRLVQDREETDVTLTDVRFYLAVNNTAIGFFKVLKIFNGPVPTLILGRWANIEHKYIESFKGYRAYNPAVEPNFFFHKDGYVMHAGRKIGGINEDKYITWRNKEHFMRKYIGFGISVELLKMLAEKSITHIVILYNLVDGGQEAYHSEIKQWQDSEMTHSFFGDMQVFLPIDKMVKS
jgi:hypothetical protein